MIHNDPKKWCFSQISRLRQCSLVGILLQFFVVWVAYPVCTVWGQEDLPTDLSGFESNDLFGVEDDVPLDADDDFLTRLIYRAGTVSKKAMRDEADASKEVENSALKAAPQDYRFWVFHRSAVVTRMARHQLPEDVATPEFKNYWLLHVKIGGETCLVISKQVPPTWGKLKEMNEPIQFYDFFFGLKSQESFLQQPESVPVFVCDRVSWYPNKASTDIVESHLLLARQGVDLASLDALRSAHGRRLSEAESEFFYQFLRAAKAVDESPDLLDSVETIEFFDLFRSWKKSTGRVVEIDGIVSRALPVVIDADRQAELGTEQVYELDLYVPLDRTIKVRDVEYDSRFPVTVQVLSLPMSPEEMKGKRIRVKGFFYRFWNYQSVYTQEAGTGGQMAPLVIGFNPREVKVSTGQIDFLLTVAAIVFVVGAVAMMWFLRRGDKNESNVLQKKKEAMPEQIDIKL